jgi:hypothetical protein
LTVIAGIRFDRQTSSLSAITIPAVPGFSLLPATNVTAANNAYDFKTVTPRVGITYALDDSRKTVARASYALFASQLPGNAASFVSPIQPYTYVYYNAIDRTTSGAPCTQVGVSGCNGYADHSEIDFAAGVQGSNNVDLSHPGVVTTNNRIGDISAPRTQEVLFGVDREVMANFGVSATFTYRYMNNFLWNPRNGVTPASYVQTGTFTGTFANVGSVNIPFYGATSALPGYTAQNRPDYHRRYLGFELSATKRMSNRWMARFGFATTSFNEYFDAGDAIIDPTRTPNASGQFTQLQQSGPLVNGGPVSVQSSGSGKSQIYLVSPKYQGSANGLYQGPWGFDFGGSLTFRQGFVEPFQRDRVATKDPVLGNKTLLLTSTVDQFRLNAVATVDARVEKMFKFNRANVALDLDVFNLFNTATVLGLQYNARVTTYDNILEVMNPRIARLGVRFSF